MHLRRWRERGAFVVVLASCAPAVPTFPADSPASEHAQAAPLPGVASALRSDPMAGWPGIERPDEGGMMMMDGGMMHHEGMHHAP